MVQHRGDKGFSASRRAESGAFDLHEQVRDSAGPPRSAGMDDHALTTSRVGLSKRIWRGAQGYGPTEAATDRDKVGAAFFCAPTAMKPAGALKGTRGWQR